MLAELSMTMATLLGRAVKTGSPRESTIRARSSSCKKNIGGTRSRPQGRAAGSAPRAVKINKLEKT
jgi:hypothetical protein